MTGFAGSGKRTVARARSRRLGWPLMDKDDIKDLLDRHIEDASRFVYHIMLRYYVQYCPSPTPAGSERHL
jgi:predicted kinase